MHGCPLHTTFRLAGRQPTRRVAARRGTAEADGAAAYTGDSAPRSRLATLSLCTTTPPPGSSWQPGTDGLLPIPCSIVRHKSTSRAALEPNKPHRSDLIVELSVCTEVAFSHIRHNLRLPLRWSSLPTVTRYIVIRNDPHRGSAHRCKIFIVAGNGPSRARTASFSSIRSVINTRPSMFQGRARPSRRFPAPGAEYDL